MEKLFYSAIVLILVLSLAPMATAEKENGEENADCFGYILTSSPMGDPEKPSLLEVYAQSQELQGRIEGKLAKLEETEALVPFKTQISHLKNANQKMQKIKTDIREKQLNNELDAEIEKAKGMLEIRPGTDQDKYFELGQRNLLLTKSTTLAISLEQAKTLKEKGLDVMCNFPIYMSKNPFKEKEVSEIVASLSEKKASLQETGIGTMPQTLIPENLQNQTGQGITIAILGTGIDYTLDEFGNCEENDFPMPSDQIGFHPRPSTCEKIKYFQNVIRTAQDLEEYDFWDNRYPEPSKIYERTDIMDDEGHTTTLATIIAGNETGIAPNATLYNYKIADSEGKSYLDTILTGIGMSISPEGKGETTNKPDLILLAINYEKLKQTTDPVQPQKPYESLEVRIRDHASRNKVLIITNSGDEGNTESEFIFGPAGNVYALSVGSIYSKNYNQELVYENCSDENPQKSQLACYNSHGPTLQKEIVGKYTQIVQGMNSYRVKPDFVAPGDFICGAMSGEAVLQAPENSLCPEGYFPESGTGVSASVVTGLAALALEYFKGKIPLSNARDIDEWIYLKQVLRNSTEPIEEFDYSFNEQGLGVLEPEKTTDLYFYQPLAILEGIYPEGSNYYIAGIATNDYRNLTQFWPTEGTAIFTGYTIEYGEGENPNEWSQLCNGYEGETKYIGYEYRTTRGSFVTQKLCNINPSNFEDGFYTLKLTSKDLRNESTDYLQFAIRNGEFVTDEIPPLPVQEATALKAKEYGLDKVLLAQDFGSVTTNTCGEYFCNASQLTISLIKSAAEASKNIEELGEITLAETQAFLIGDYYNDAFKNNFTQEYASDIQELETQNNLQNTNLLDLSQWNYNVGETVSGQYSITLATTKTETGYENTTVSLSKLKSLAELDSEQGTKYSQNLFLKKRNSTPLVDEIKGESIPAYASEETIQPLSTDSLGIGIIQTYQYNTPAELQDGTIIHLKLEQEGENPLYKLYYKESYPLKFQTQTSQPTELYYALFEGDTIITENTEETYGEGIDYLVEWRKGSETINTTLEETTACNQPENKYMEHLTAEDTTTGTTFLPNGTTIGFTCSETDTTITPTHYTEKALHTKTPLQLTGETWYGQGGNTVQITSDDMTSLQHYINLLKEPENKYINFTATETEFKMYWNKEKIMKIA